MNKTLSATLFFTCTLPLVAFAADNCSTHRNSLVDNANYNIWSTVICPHRPVAKHTHAHPRVLIPHDNGTLRVTYADKPLGQDNPRDFKLEKDKPIYLDYNEGKDMHTDEVLGDSPLTVLVIELKTAP